MNLDGWLKLGHILGAIVWVGGGLTLSVLASRVRARQDPAAIREFGATLAYVGPRVLTPGVIATVAFGVALVLTSAAWDFTQLWVILGIALFVVAFAIGVGYLARIGLALNRLAGDAGAPTGDADALLGRWILGYRIVLIVLVVTVADMVLKPGL